MFERFSGPARRVVASAFEEARELNQSEVGPEHLLIGLIREHDGIAAGVLGQPGISEAVGRQIQANATSSQLDVPIMSRSLTVFQGSLRAAQQLGQEQVGTAHLLLAVIRADDRAGARVLVNAGVDLHALEEQLIRRLQSEGEEPPGAGQQSIVRAHLSGSPSGHAVSAKAPPAMELEQLRAEVSRLQALLLQHGIDPMRPS
jgi:ATP-dependent Clp protease ATP-binding subunit ClpA